MIEADAEARWTGLTGADGAPFRGKIEGLSRDVRDRRIMHFVIDDDDENTPSRIYQAVLNDAYFEAPAWSPGQSSSQE